MQILEFSAGSHIDAAAEALVAAAKRGTPAQGEFNGITLIANGTNTAAEIIAAWHDETDGRRAAYESSPEGLAAKQRSEEARATLQDRHDALMQRLGQLDWNSDVDILAWLCEMQGPSDRAGVRICRETIITTFEQHGFKPGVNTGADYEDGNRDNMFRYLVGQALDGLNRLAIHPIIHGFAAEWRARFGLAAK